MKVSYSVVIEPKLKISRINKMTSVDEMFFKFLFFDPYLRPDDGSQRFAIANQFTKYLSTIPSIPSAIKGTTPYTRFQSLFGGVASPSMSTFTSSEEARLTTKFMNDLRTYSSTVLLSGYSNSEGGHAIVLYIEYRKDNSSLYIINSGEGVNQYHGHCSVPGERNVVIQYTGISDVTLDTIFKIHLFCNSAYTDRDVQAKQSFQNLPINGTNVLPDIFDMYIKPHIIIKKNSLQIVTIDLYYTCIQACLLPNTFTVKATDVEQLSGSCTFFSSFYFIKHFIFKTSTSDPFIQKVKEAEISKFMTITLPLLTVSTTPVNTKQSIIQSSQLLLKDGAISSSDQITIKESVLAAYTFSNSFGDIQVPSINSKDPDILDIIKFYNKFCSKPLNGINSVKEIFDTIPFSDIFTVGRYDTLAELIRFKCLIMAYNSIIPSLPMNALDNDPIFNQIYTKSNFEYCHSYTLNIFLQCILKQYKIPPSDTPSRGFIIDSLSMSDSEVHTYIKSICNQRTKYMYGFNLHNLSVQIHHLRSVIFYSKYDISNISHCIAYLFRYTSNFIYRLRVPDFPGNIRTALKNFVAYQSYHTDHEELTPMSDLENIIQSINSDIRISEADNSICTVVQNSNDITRIESKFFDTIVNIPSPVSDAEPFVIYKIESTPFYDNIDIVSTIDLVKLKDSLHSIPPKILEKLLYYMYLVRNKYTTIKAFFTTNKPTIQATVPPGSLINYILAEDYDKIFSYTKDNSFLGDNIVLNICCTDIFLSLDQNDSNIFFNKVLAMPELTAASGYTYINDMTIRKNIGVYYKLYEDTTTKQMYYQRPDKKMVLIEPNGSEFQSSINSEKVTFKPSETFPSNPLEPILTKLTSTGVACTPMVSITNKYLHLCEFNDSFFSLLADGSLHFHENGTKYTVLKETDFSPLLGLWSLFASNIIPVKKGGEYLLVVFMTSAYVGFVNDLELSTYFGTKKPKGGAHMNQSSKYHIIPLHHTLLNVNTVDYNDLAALYISYVLSRNVFALQILWPLLRNCVLYGEVPSVSLYTNLKNIQQDTPLWPLYEKKVETNLLLEKYFLYSSLTAPFRWDSSLFTPDSLAKYNSICNLRLEFRESEGARKMPPTNLNYVSEYKYKYTCKAGILPEAQRLISGLSNPATAHPYTVAIENDIFKTVLWYENTMPSVGHMFLLNYHHFYSNLLNMLYAKIIKSIKTTDPALPGKERCASILKAIDLFDETSNIHGIALERTKEDVLFELQSTFLMRKFSKDVLTKISTDLIAPIGSTPAKAYEILMGQGKTSVITPMTILYQYLRNRSDQYMVCLPSHLVKPSFQVLLGISSLVPNILITTNINILKDGKNYIIPISVDELKKNTLYGVLDKDPWSPFRENNLIIYDEIDSLLNPLKSDLNIPDEEIKHAHIDTIVDICLSIGRNYNTNTSSVRNPKANITIQHPDRPAVLLYSGFLDNLEFARVLQDKITRTLGQLSSKIYNQSYGFVPFPATSVFDELMNVSNKQWFVAIPYKANNTPVKGSEYSDFELSLLMTVNAYHKAPVRKEDICTLFIFIIRNFEPLFKKNIIKDPTMKKKLYEAYYSDVFKIFTYQNIEDFSTFYESNAWVEAMNLCKPLAVPLQSSPINKTIFINIFMKTFVVPKFFSIKKIQHNISAVDLFDPSRSTRSVSFSGTVNFNAPGSIIQNEIFSRSMPDTFYKGQIITTETDESVGRKILYSFFGATTTEPELITYTEPSSEEALRRIIGDSFSTPSPYQALIDTAGIFVNTTPVLLMKYLWDRLTSGRKNECPTTMFIYFNEDGEKFIYNGDEPPLPYKNQSEKDVFIFYDQNNCVGADVQQFPRMKGLVTISKNNNLTEIAQGIFRLRQINVGHWVDFYIPERYIATAGTKEQKLLELYTKLKQKDEEFKINVLENTKLQCVKYVHRLDSNRTEPSYKETLFYDTFILEGAKGFLNQSQFIQAMYEAYPIHRQYMIRPINLGNKNLDSQQEGVIVQENVATKVQTNQNTQVVTVIRGFMDSSLFRNKKVEMNEYAAIKNVFYTTNLHISISSKYTEHNDYLLESLMNIKTTVMGSVQIYMSNQLFISIFMNQYREAKLRCFNHGFYVLCETGSKVGSPPIGSFLLLNYLEVYAIRSRNLLSSYPTLGIYDKFGRLSLGNGSPMAPVPQELWILLFPEALTFIQTFLYLQMLQSNNSDTMQKIYFLRTRVGVKYEFNLELDSPSWQFKNSYHFNDPKNWENLFNLPTIVNEPVRKEFFKAMVESYNDYALLSGIDTKGWESQEESVMCWYLDAMQGPMATPTVGPMPTISPSPSYLEMLGNLIMWWISPKKVAPIATAVAAAAAAAAVKKPGPFVAKVGGMKKSKKRSTYKQKTRKRVKHLRKKTFSSNYGNGH